MKHLDTGDWLAMNGMIYRIHATEDEREMRRDFLEQLKMLIDFDAADFYLSSDTKDTGLTDPVSLGYQRTEDSPEESEGPEGGNGLFYVGRNMVYRETDVSDERERRENPYYQKVYRSRGWDYAMRIILAKDECLLGVVTLCRRAGKENFTGGDIFLAELLVDHLSFRLARERASRQQKSRKWTVTQAAEHFLLTRREEVVLRLIMAGKEREEICRELSISINTLKKHTANIYRKLGISSRVQLFKMILERE